MSQLTKSRIKSLVFLVVILIMIIPQTRSPFQVAFHKLLAEVRSVEIELPKERSELSSYNWILKDSTGTVYNFNSAKGKVVLINFWATWCPPCIAEMPSLQKLYDKYKNKVEFLFVTDDSFDMVNAFNSKKGYSFKVYQSKTDSSQIFDIKSIPRTFLIDKDGRIALDKSGAIDWFSTSVQKQIEVLLDQ